MDDVAWIAESLEIARELLRAGVPIRPAKRAMRKTDSGWRWDRQGGNDGTGYWFPKGWQQTTASEAWLEDWEPGDALMLITGHTVDGFDVDPRHDGEESVNQLRAEGKLPNGTGRQETPSGGWHTLIAPLGLGSDNGARPGVDVKSGNGEEGRGFLFIAPTVKVSKTTGETGRYRWVERPDVSVLKGDTSGRGLAEEIRSRRNGNAATPERGNSRAWLTDGEPTERVRTRAAKYHAEVIGGRARHDAARDTILALIRYGEQGDSGVRVALDELRQTFTADLFGEPGRTPEQEFNNALSGAIARVSKDRTPAVVEPGELFLPGDEFLNLAAADEPPLWGVGEVCLWMPGESLMLVGPPGVGKSTLAHLLVWGWLGLLDEVLAWPALPDALKPEPVPVLYLAMDRPRQIARAMRRLVRDEHWPILQDRLKVRSGPLPVDLCESPEWARDRALEIGAGLIVVDSIKDVLPDPSDEKRAGQYNLARQHTLAAGIEWIELHHNRKSGAGNKEPNTLDDVYGSRWLTAGAGSVLSLYGEAGDTVVSLKQLKMPAGDFFPRRVLLDKERGQMSLYEAVTVESLLTHAGPFGKTVQGIARELYGTDKPNASQVESVRGKLKRMAKGGQVEEFTSKVDGRQMWRAVDLTLDVPTPSPTGSQRGPNAQSTGFPTSPTSTANAQVKGSNARSNVSNVSPTSRGSLMDPDVGAGTSTNADPIGDPVGEDAAA